LKNGYLPVWLAMVALLSACNLDNGSSAAPPANMAVAASDAKVKVTWTANSGVEYWLFTASDAALTAFNWTGLANGHVYIKANTPFYACGLLNGTAYYYAANGRINGGPGGASSSTINATPHRSGNNWTPLPAPLASNINGVGYTGLTTCSNNANSASGQFVAVGANGTIFTSNTVDGLSALAWSDHSVAGFPHSLNAASGYAANQNNTVTPGLLWVAVGEGGASFISTDAAATWSVGAPYNAAKPSFRAIVTVGTTFWAVGDADVANNNAATIISSTDGKTWTTHATTATTQNLNSITYGSGLFVAVGNNGTLLTSTDGNTWTARSSNTTSTLRQVTSMLNIFVAVGDNGTILTSSDQGVTWTSPAASVSANHLIGIASNMHLATLDLTGATFNSPNAGTQNLQFIAIDNQGYYYTSADGLSWSSATSTGVANLNTIAASGFGYIAAGNGGNTVQAF